MKSPFVEALRQASGEESPDDASQTVAEESAQEAPTPGQAEADALVLLETMEILPLEGSPGDAPVAAGADDGAADDIDDLAPPATATGPRQVGSIRVAVSGSGPQSALARLGLYAPLICLVLAGVTAAAHVLYRSAANSLAASPVASMPERAATDPAMPGAAGSNRFPLLRAAGETVPTDAEELVAQSPRGSAQ